MKILASRKIIISLAVLILLTTFSFYPASKNGFVNWDDDKYILLNSSVRFLTLDGMKGIFTISNLEEFRKSPLEKIVYIPLTIISFAVEYHFFKLAPEIYHITNIMIHILNSLLVFWLIFIFSKGNRVVSLVASLLFAIHPIHVESVAWVSERKDVLYGFFFLCSLLYYLFYLNGKKLIYYIVSIILFIFSLLSKPMAITLPFELLLIDYLTGRNDWKQMLKEKIPYFLLTFVFFCIAMILIEVNRKAGTGFLYEKGFYSFSNSIAGSSYAMILYFLKIFLPVNLSCYYTFPGYSLNNLGIRFSFYPFLFAASSGFIFMLMRYSRVLTFGFLFYLIAMLPVIRLFPPEIAADRFTYISFIGLSYIVAETIFRLYGIILSSSKKIAECFKYIAVTIFAIMVALTWNRCLVWENDCSLWSDVLKNNREVPVAFNHRGNYFARNKDYDKAISDFNNAILLRPNSTQAYINRGALYLEMKEYDKALFDFRQASGIKPDDPYSYVNIGHVLREKRDLPGAILQYSNALKIDPYFADAYNSRGIIYYKLMDYKNALRDFSRAIELMPDFAFAYNNRGDTYREMGDIAKATDDYKKALVINPLYSVAYTNLGILSINSSDYENAIIHFTSAINTDPFLIVAYVNRGTAYRMKKKFNLALMDYNRAISINPSYTEAFMNRGILYGILGQYERAVSDFTCVVEKSQYEKGAYYNRAMTYYLMKEYKKAKADSDTLRKLGFNHDDRLFNMIDEALKKAR